MRCLTPRQVKVPGLSNVWHNFQDGHDDNGNPKWFHFDYVPCGKCYRCLSNKRMDWVFRLMYELKDSSSAYFLTLTYDDEHIPIVSVVDQDTGEVHSYQSVSKKDIIDFHRRLIYHVPNLRYYLISELGEHTHRPHYHAIYFNLPNDIGEVDRLISSLWRKGNIYVGTVTGASINYVAKYSIQPHQPEDGITERMFSLMSTHPAIGSKYLTEVKDWHRADISRMFHYFEGVKRPLPKYYKDRLYTQDERHKFTELYMKQKEDEVRSLSPADFDQFIQDCSELSFQRVKKAKEEERYLSEKISKLSKI